MHSYSFMSNGVSIHTLFAEDVMVCWKTMMPLGIFCVNMRSTYLDGVLYVLALGSHLQALHVENSQPSYFLIGLTPTDLSFGKNTSN